MTIQPGTVADEIVKAHQAVTKAEQHRAALLKAARQNGVSLRALAPLLGVSFNTIARWAPIDERPDRSAHILNAPARKP